MTADVETKEKKNRYNVFITRTNFVSVIAHSKDEAGDLAFEMDLGDGDIDFEAELDEENVEDDEED
jgi:hypothetical protein